MATEKVGVYRKYHGPVPRDSSGKPLPRRTWPQKRLFRWAVRWFGPDGKRYSRSFKTRKEAAWFAERKQADVRNGRADPPKPVTLGEFNKMYLQIRNDLTIRSRQEHARALEFLKDRFGPERLIRGITPLDARQFVSLYRRRKSNGHPLAPATVNKLVRECRRIFREAVDCELIEVNPFSGIRQAKVGQADWHYVSPPEYDQLLKACPSLRWRGMITLAYCCGLRLGEMLNLTWSDIDFETARLRVVRKRAKPGTTDWTPKDKDMRIVPLPDAALSVLAELQHAAGDGQVYVFVNGKGPARGDRVKRRNIWRDFQAFRRKSGVPRCTLHDLRKSYCTNLAGALPMHVVQELAGHSDIRTTRQFYLKVRPEFMESARRAVDEMLNLRASLTDPLLTHTTTCSGSMGVSGRKKRV